MKNLKLFLTLFLMTTLTLSVWAVPAYRGWQERTLTDGTPITLRQIGDEFYHFWETQDGKIAVEQEDGTFVITDQPHPTKEQIQKRRTASNMYQTRSTRTPRKAIGERNFAPKGLVILVQFQNVSFKSANNATAFNNMLNQEGYSDGGSIGSAKDYFKAQSNGQYVPQFDVFGPVTLPNNLVYYGEQGTINGSSEHDMYIADFVIDAVQAADDAGCNFADYDSDGDGYVDIVYLFYAGKGQAAGGTSETIWPHNWELESALYYKQTHGTSGYYYNDTYPYKKNIPCPDGKYINNYVCSAELKSSGSRSGIGTLCHEFSHVLGLPDYYDTEYGDNDDNGVTPGEWSLMDQGSYNGDEMTPPNYSIFDKYFMGWATPKFLAKDVASNVIMTTGYDDAYQITGGASGPVAYTNTGTVYYIENRQQTGWDAGIPGSGMLVWQVQYNSSAWENNEPNNTAGNPRCTIVPADGKTTNYGYQSDMFPTGSVKSYKPFDGCDLTSITKSGSNVTFLYNGGLDCHNVITNGIGCTITPSTSCVENDNAMQATITPTDETYDHTNTTVKLGGTVLAKNTYYKLQNENRELIIFSTTVKGATSNAITITSEWTKNRCTYEAVGDNCTISSDEGTVDMNAALNLTITPSAGYSLADASCWDVTMGGTQLVYGTGFTYNASTGAFSIGSVTGNVDIIIQGGYTVTWSANGSNTTSVFAPNAALVLPANPSDCSGSGGKKFVGWTASSSVSGSAPVDLFTSAGSKTVTGNTTYYAVYANGSGSGSGDPSSASYTFTSKSWAATEGNWTSGKDGAGYNNNGVQVTTGASGANATCPTSYSNITSIVVSYCTNASKGAGSIKMTVDGTDVSNSVSTSGGTSARDLEFDFSGTKPSGAPQITVTCTTNSIYICGVTINYGGGGSSSSYTDYSTTCTLCTLTGITLNTDGVTKTFTQGNAFTYDGLIVNASYSDCSGRTVSPTDVSSPDMSTTGEKTITVTYTENEVTKTATYKINVDAAPTYTIRFYDGSTKLKEESLINGAMATPPSDPAGCTDYVFYGWWIEALGASNTTAQKVTNFTVSGAQDYYAVYSHTVAGSGSGDPSSASYTFTSKSWAATEGNWTSGSDGAGYNNNGVQVTTGASGANATCPTSYSNISSIVVSYCTNASKGAGSIKMTVDGTDVSNSVSTSGGTSARDLEFDFSGTKPSGAPQITVTCTTNSIYICGVTINYGGGGSSSTTYYTTTKDCTIPTEVTVTFNKNDGTDASTSQTIPYNTATALTANAFSRTGYTFQGWATSTSGAKVYDDKQSVTLTANTQLYAVWEKNNYNVSFSVPSGATSVTVNGASTSPQSVAFEAEVSIVVTPDGDHVVSSITATGGASLSGTGNSRTFTMPASDVSITVTMAEKTKYTVTWSVNGDESNKVQYEEGEEIAFPSSADGCDGKVFMGWSASAIYPAQDEAPTYVTEKTMGTSNLTYYAVFADAEEGSGSGSGDPSSASYTFTSKSWAATEGNWTSGSDGAGYNNNGVQVTTGASGANATCPTSYSNISSIVVSYCTNASKGAGSIKMTVDGTDVSNSVSTSGGTSARDLEFDFSGTKPSGAPQITVTCTTNSIYICGVTINYGGGGSSGTTYSGYTTSCTTPTEVTVKFDANGGEGTMADQVIPYNTATALTANAFSRTGYTFQGWATTSTGSKVYDNQEAVSLKKLTTTLYAVWQKNSYTITLNELAHGTLETSPANTAEFGATVTVTVTPSSGYLFGSITVTNNTTSATIATSGSGNEQTFTMPASDVTITATVTEIPKYTVTWSMDGDESTKVEYTEGQAIVFPTTATGCDGKTFVGWSTETIAETDEVPTTFITSATMGTSNLTYYAVFADADEGSGSGSGSGDPSSASYTFTSKSWAATEGNWTSGSDGAGYNNNGVQVTTGASGANATCPTSYSNISSIVVSYCTNASKGAGSIKMTVDGTDVSNSVSTSGGTSARNLTFDFSGTKPSGAPQITVTCTTNSIYICGVTINYGSGGSSSAAYTGYTTSCGAGISAKNVGWITATKGQKVKRVINVSAKGFDEATTLSAVSSNSHFAVSLGATAVPVSGLTTTLTVEYTPADFGAREENVEITLTAGDKTKTITVNGRSLPEEFVIITKKSDKWYALPANMKGGLKEYAGEEVNPNNTTTPTVVPISPSTIIYTLTSVVNDRYSESGNCVRLVGNDNLCLWSNLASSSGSKANIQNKTGASGDALKSNEWLLTTTDGVHYTIANPNHPLYAEGHRLGFDTKFGMYTGTTEFFIVSAGCSNQPEGVNVSPHRLDATFAWVSNASSVTIDVYTNADMDEGHLSATATSSPHVFTGLVESTKYWFRLTPGTDTDCAVTGSFETTGPTIDITEWTDGAVVIHVDDDELTPVISIDGQEEHGSIAGGGATATELFFAKYFEGAGDMKLLSIFNGTGKPINLNDSNYTIYMKCVGNTSNTWSTANDKNYDLGELGIIKAGQEIILFTPPSSGQTPADCSTEFLASKESLNGEDQNPRWIKCDGSTFKKLDFSGNDPLLLKKRGVVIDVIGAQDSPPDGASKDCRSTDRGWQGTVKNMDFGKSASDPEFAYIFDATSKPHDTEEQKKAILAGVGINLEDENINICSARCILFRNKTVTSGENATTKNTTDFVTFTPDEWNGRTVCMTETMYKAAGFADDGIGTCNSYQDLGAFDFNDYYIDWTNIIPGITLYPEDKNEDGDYVIQIANMDKYTCMELRFKLMKEGVSVTDVAQKVPIIITGDAETDDEIFSELVKDEDGNPVDISYSRERCATCDVVVLGTGSLTKVTSSATDVAEVGNVKIYSGGSLIVPSGATYTVNSISFRREEDELATANIQGNVVLKDDGIINKVFFDLRVDPSNWHYFSLPYDVNISDISFVNDDTHKPAIGVDFFIEYYDGEKRARTQSTGCWAMMPADGVLKKGIGYIFGIPGSGNVKREFRFPMSNDVMSEEKADKQVNGIYAYGCDDPNVRPNHRGWNLIGNPYLMNYTTDITDPLLTGLIVPDYPEDPEEKWDGHWKFDPEPSTNLRYIVEPVNNGRSEYIQTTMADYPMNPFTCYFVQVGGTDPDAIQGVEFHLGQVDRTPSPVRRAPAEYEEKEDTHPVWCTVNITNAKGEKDETSMLISNDFTDGYDMMDDLAKMRGTYYQYAQVTTKPIIASRNNEGEMAFNALPDASAEAGIPLNYFAAAQGDYTIAYDDKYDKNQEVKEVKLLDKQENEWYDLMEESYTFTSKRVDNTDRFELYVRVERKQPQITTPIDGVGSGDGNGFDTPRKVLINDHVYIQRGGVIYDMTGKQMLNQ